MLMRPDVLSPQIPLPLWQSPAFARALRAIGTKADLIPLGLAGHVLRVRRRIGPFGHVAFASRGPVWAEGASEAMQIAALRDSGLHIINADGTSQTVLRGAGFRRIIAPLQLARLHRRDTLDAQLAACHGKWRNAYRQGVHRGLTLRHRPFRPVGDDWIFARDRAQQKAKGYRALPHGIVQAMHQRDPGSVLVSLAQESGRPVAVMLFLLHGRAATYHIGWSGARGRRLCAHHVLLMTAAQAMPVDWIELGPVDPAMRDGLARFKLGSGAMVHDLGGTWIKVPFL